MFPVTKASLKSKLCFKIIPTSLIYWHYQKVISCQFPQNGYYHLYSHSNILWKHKAKFIRLNSSLTFGRQNITKSSVLLGNLTWNITSWKGLQEKKIQRGQGAMVAWDNGHLVGMKGCHKSDGNERKPTHRNIQFGLGQDLWWPIQPSL